MGGTGPANGKADGNPARSNPIKWVGLTGRDDKRYMWITLENSTGRFEHSGAVLSYHSERK